MSKRDDAKKLVEELKEKLAATHEKADQVIERLRRKHEKAARAEA